MRKLAVVFFALATLFAQEPIDGEEQELALRADPWTHLVVTLKNGKKVTFTRAEIAKVQYIIQRNGGSASGAGSDWMGRVWRIRESAPDGRHCDATWTRQGNTNRFSGQWVCSWGARVGDTLVVQPLKDRSIVVFREGIRQNYRGTLGADGRAVSGVTWSAGGAWKGRIE